MRLLAVAVVVTCWSASVDATPAEPIVLASGDDAFRAALADALAPAGMNVVAVDNPPSPSIGDVASASRALADGKQASATVWLVFDATGTTLVTYDRDVDRVLVRSLPFAPPLSPEQAAEAARMARTMLRALRVTPDLDVPPPRAVDAAAVRAHAATPPPPIVVTAPVPSLVALEVEGGMRFGGPGGDANAQGTISAVWRPDRLGAVLAAAIAPRDDVRSSMFTGTAADDSVAIAVRWPVRLADTIAIAGLAGGAVHVIRLDGDVIGGDHVSSLRIDPSVRAGVAAIYDRGSVGVHAGVFADWLVRRQLYQVGDEEVLRIPRFQLSIGLGLTARLF